MKLAQSVSRQITIVSKAGKALATKLLVPFEQCLGGCRVLRCLSAAKRMAPAAVDLGVKLIDTMRQPRQDFRFDLANFAPGLRDYALLMADFAHEHHAGVPQD